MIFHTQTTEIFLYISMHFSKHNLTPTLKALFPDPNLRLFSCVLKNEKQ